MCDWEGYTTGTIGLPNPNQRRRENVWVPPSLYIGIPCGRSSGEILGARGEGLTWTGQPAWQGSVLFFSALGIVAKHTAGTGKIRGSCARHRALWVGARLEKTSIVLMIRHLLFADAKELAV